MIPMPPRRPSRRAILFALVAGSLLAACSAGPPRASDAPRADRTGSTVLMRQKLRAELAAVPGGGAFEMRVEADALRIVLPARDIFRPDSAELRATAAPLLQGWGAVLAKHPRARVLVTGHTDAIGRAAYNQEFSLRRAEAVRAALQAGGADATHLEARGAGEAEPRSSQPGIPGREANRRVELRIRP